jgi:hypothetical protein
VAYASSGAGWDALKCVPVLGDQAIGEPCVYAGMVEATDDCDAGSSCWDVEEVDGELLGYCRAFCLGSEDDPICPAGSTCAIAGDSIPTYCRPFCDPLAQDCEEGTACYWATDSFQCVFTTQDIPVGQPCGFVNDCAAGLICDATEDLPACVGSACCTAFCDLEVGDAACEAALPGSECVPFYENVGTCGLP